MERARRGPAIRRRKRPSRAVREWEKFRECVTELSGSVTGRFCDGSHDFRMVQRSSLRFASTPKISLTGTLAPRRGRLTPAAIEILAATSPLPRIAMVSTHGYVAANPPLGAADTGGQVVYVIELSKKLALLGYQVDIWMRRFEEQPEIERVADRVRIIRVPCGGGEFLRKEYLCDHLPEWN